MASLISRLSASVYEAVFRRLARRKPPKAQPIALRSTARVLCFTCAGIGDTLTDSVVFKALLETFPEAHLGAVVHRRRCLLLEHNPHVDEVFLFHKGPLAFRRLRAELQKSGPWDAILHLRFNGFLLELDLIGRRNLGSHISLGQQRSGGYGDQQAACEDLFQHRRTPVWL